MEGKIKELVAIGASIGAECTRCLDHHQRLAKEFGATAEEIEQAKEIALRVKKNSERHKDGSTA